MITSPPYPNHRDFSTIFAPENAFLTSPIASKQWSCARPKAPIIGSNFISGSPESRVDIKCVISFLERAASLARSSQARYDDDKYYFPYFSSYFAGLGAAYANVAKSLAASFEGYIIVVDNTHRGLVVPVSAAIVELWQTLGFKAEIVESIEAFHVGTKNPRARGPRARHTGYLVRLIR